MDPNLNFTTGQPSMQPGNIQLQSGNAVFETANPSITTPIVSLGQPVTAPLVQPALTTPMVVTSTVTIPAAAPAPTPAPKVDLAPIEKPENKAKLASRPTPAFAPVRAPVAPAVTDFTTPHRYHNTTAHVADVAHDPRPLLPVDNEVHDFEVHREGAYSKGHTVPGAGVHKTSAGTSAAGAYPAAQGVTNTAGSKHGPTVAPAGAGLYTGGTGYTPIGPGAEASARPHVYREGLVGTNVAGVTPAGAAVVTDPRPPLPLEREIHDFEVHREGKHAAGHTRPGAKPEGTYVGAVPASVQVKGNTTNIYAAGPAAVVPGAPAVPGAYPTGTYPSTRQ